MRKSAIVLAATFVVGCAGMIPSQSKDVCLILTPRINEGALSTQTAVNVYTSASIDHLTIKLYQGSTEVASKTIPQSDILSAVSFSHLKAGTTYRIKTYAYLANSALISHDDATSWLDVTLGTNDAPSIAALPVHLIDIPFEGQGTSSIQVTPGGYSYESSERMGVVLKGIVTTVAGGVGATGSVDGTGASARFYSPYGMVPDNMGNLYVADYDNNVIRKISLATGCVTTIAGTKGATGSVDGTGTSAQFYHPNGLALDGLGNLYIADYYNHSIRKMVLASGVVTTFAGTKGSFGSTDGIGTSAKFYYPYALTSDGLGNLYVADEYNHVIRKIVLASGEVTTFVGQKGTHGPIDGIGAAAQFYYPDGLALDGRGNLFVADQFNDSVRKIVLASGEVSTIAGLNGATGIADGVGTSARLNRPTGLAYDGIGNLYVADERSHTIRKVELETQAVTTLAGTKGATGSVDGTGTSAQFFYPMCLAMDDNGNLYVADKSNQLIRRIQ